MWGGLPILENRSNSMLLRGRLRSILGGTGCYFFLNRLWGTILKGPFMAVILRGDAESQELIASAAKIAAELGCSGVTRLTDDG